MNASFQDIDCDIAASSRPAVLALPAGTAPATPATPRLQAWLELPNGRSFRCRSRTTVGRQVDNDLVLATDTVSRRHALLSRRSGHFIVADLHSSNGTFVNDAPVTRTTALRNGDALRFGGFAVRYRCSRWSTVGTVDAPSLHTLGLDHIGERECWILLADIAGYSSLSREVGSRVALQRLQAWITGLRPLIEQCGGRINSYVGDAVLAWWPAGQTASAQVHQALSAIHGWRGRSPVPFRIVLHYGSVLFARSERGDELGGDDVNLVFRAEKVAKRFGANAMLSAAAVKALNLADRCITLGTAAVEGLAEPVAFFAPPVVGTL